MLLFIDLLVCCPSPLLESEHRDARKLLGRFNTGRLLQPLAQSRYTISIFWKLLLNALNYRLPPNKP